MVEGPFTSRDVAEFYDDPNQPGASACLRRLFVHDHLARTLVDNHTYAYILTARGKRRLSYMRTMGQE